MYDLLTQLSDTECDLVASAIEHYLQSDPDISWQARSSLEHLFMLFDVMSEKDLPPEVDGLEYSEEKVLERRGKIITVDFKPKTD
jgi:hypothetical protein